MVVAQSLHQLVAPIGLAKIIPRIRVDCPDDLKFDVVACVTESLRGDPAVQNGLGLVRASNTQPALVVRCEASDRQALDEIKATIEAHVAAARR